MQIGDFLKASFGWQDAKRANDWASKMKGQPKATEIDKQVQGEHGKVSVEAKIEYNVPESVKVNSKWVYR